MSDDPPWIDEAAKAARDAFDHKSPLRRNWDAVARAVLAIAARKPRPITDAKVEAAFECPRVQDRSPKSGSARRARSGREGGVS